MIDLNPGEIAELKAHLNFWKLHYMFCWIASLQSRPDATGPAPPLRLQPSRGRGPAGRCGETLGLPQRGLERRRKAGCTPGMWNSSSRVIHSQPFSNTVFIPETEASSFSFDFTALFRE